MIVEQGGGLQLHVVQHGEEVEERVAGLADENLAARIAEQPEEVAVGLAGAGGEHDLLGRERNAVAGIVAADRLPRRQSPLGLRIVIQCLRPGERLQQFRSIIKAAAGRVRGGQIGDGQTGLDAQPVSARQFALLRIPVCSPRKTHTSNPVNNSQPPYRRRWADHAQ